MDPQKDFVQVGEGHAELLGQQFAGSALASAAGSEQPDQHG
jgi:hypothetical protein